MQIKTKDEAYAPMDFIEKAAFQASSLTQQLVCVLRGEEPDKKTQYIGGIIQDAAHLGLSGSNVKCTNRISEDLDPVQCDSVQIYQMFSNIVINARESMPYGGNLEISAINKTLIKGDIPCLKAGAYIVI